MISIDDISQEDIQTAQELIVEDLKARYERGESFPDRMDTIKEIYSLFEGISLKTAMESYNGMLSACNQALIDIGYLPAETA